MTTYLLCVLVVAVGCICFSIGHRRGLADRKIDLSGLGATEAFGYFLNHEIDRHRRDIAAAKMDLKKLTDKGILVPDIPVGLWIEVKK